MPIEQQHLNNLISERGDLSSLDEIKQKWSNNAAKPEDTGSSEPVRNPREDCAAVVKQSGESEIASNNGEQGFAGAVD